MTQNKTKCIFLCVVKMFCPGPFFFSFFFVFFFFSFFLGGRGGWEGGLMKEARVLHDEIRPFALLY